jgi:hypothetical protein
MLSVQQAVRVLVRRSYEAMNALQRFLNWLDSIEPKEKVK